MSSLAPIRLAAYLANSVGYSGASWPISAMWLR